MRAHPTTNPIARLPGSGRGHLANLQADLQERLSDGWCVEQADGRDGDQSLVIMKVADEHAAIFVVSTTPLDIEMHELRGDELQEDSPTASICSSVNPRPYPEGARRDLKVT